ncbi:MAG: hypothetical protein ACKOAT_02505, partial [Actinomycetota bacterium]
MIAITCFRLSRSVGSVMTGWFEMQTLSPTKIAVFSVAPFSESRVRSDMSNRAATRLHESFGFAVWVRVQGEAKTSDWPSGTSTDDSASTT